MSGITFQKIWRITVGQFANNTFKEIFNLDKNHFTASIPFKLSSSSGVETPKSATFNLFNINYDFIRILSTYKNLYLKMQAGYRYQYGVRTEHLEDLPQIYLGNIIYTNTMARGRDVVTTINCSAIFDKTSKAKTNITVPAKSNFKTIFTVLASDIGLPIEYHLDFKDMDIIQDAVLEGASATLLTQWCSKWGLLSCIEDGVIHIYHKEYYKKRKRYKGYHEIPMEMIQGVVEVSKDITKILKGDESSPPSVKMKTFLYPNIKLGDKVATRIIDYTKIDSDGTPLYTTQEFIVDEYTHKLSARGSDWYTEIKGKGE